MESRIAEQGWLGVRDAAIYAGRISPDIVRRAIASGELRAHAKPRTYPEASRTDAPRWRVSKADVDEWIRTYWEPSGGERDGLYGR